MGRGGPPKGMKKGPVRVGYFRRFFAASSTEVPMGRGGPPKGMKTRPVRAGYFRRFFAASSTERYSPAY